MKDLRKNALNVIRYMKDSDQDTQEVPTMMQKLGKAWEEFQEKLKETKEGKTSPQVSTYCGCMKPV